MPKSPKIKNMNPNVNISRMYLCTFQPQLTRKTHVGNYRGYVFFEIHIVFRNLSKIYKFSRISIYKSRSFLSDLGLCIFHKEIHANPFKYIMKSNLLVNPYD